LIPWTEESPPILPTGHGGCGTRAGYCAHFTAIAELQLHPAYTALIFAISINIVGWG